MGSEIRIIVPMSEKKSVGTARTLLVDWLRNEASVHLNSRVKYFSERMVIRYNQVVIKDTRSRWGSCSGKGNINFNWRIIMAPEEVIDYIVIHELAHITNMDHSKSFWNVVKNYCAEYKNHQMWLRVNGEKLFFV
ncbi:MAG: M48 family metallopeptidase [Candidatus Riflebacteria bacterium]|nr:M48 family metallopeptidase [Candidatus Riflebacteria bacterium]